MNLDFLDVLSQPSPKPPGTLGTAGTVNVHAGFSVPRAIPACGNSGNKTGNTEDRFPIPIADTAKCSHLFPPRSQPMGTELANDYAPVPVVPAVPTQNDISARPTGSGRMRNLSGSPGEHDPAVQRPLMPAGVRLLSYAPVTPSVRLSAWETVVDSQRFIESTLRQLDARLHGKHWLAGNWTLSGLVDRMAAAGCLVELVDAKKKEKQHEHEREKLVSIGA
jgi:hypothetical protein